MGGIGFFWGGAGLRLRERGANGRAANTCETGWLRLGKWLGSRRQQL